MGDEEKKAISFIKYNTCISDKDLEKSFKNKNLVDKLVDEAIKTQYKDNELKILQKIIENQQKEIEGLEKERKQQVEAYRKIVREKKQLDAEGNQMIDELQLRYNIEHQKYLDYKKESITKSRIRKEIQELEKMKENIEEIDVSRIKFAELILESRIKFAELILESLLEE